LAGSENPNIFLRFFLWEALELACRKLAGSENPNIFLRFFLREAPFFLREALELASWHG
jgi:hypothetical protein